METALYNIIEFTKESRPKNRSVDFVPRSWIKFDLNTGGLVTKFMPPPYDDESSSLLHSLIEYRAPAPEDWPEFAIDIRGEANSCAEAVNKLKVLSKKEYAYSTDDEHAKQKALVVTKEYESQGADMWAVPELVDNKSPLHDENLADLSIEVIIQTQISNETKETATGNSEVTKATLIKSKGKTLSQSGNLKRKRNATSPESKKARESPALQSVGKPHADAMPGTSKKPEAVVLTSPNKTVLFEDLVTVVNPHELSEDVKHLVAKVFRSQTVQLTRISSQLDDLKVLIKESNGDATHRFIIIDDFENKWGLTLPIRTLDDFQTLDEKLTDDQAFQDDAINCMSGFVDSGAPLGNSVRAVFKKFISRDLTQHFTTAKDIGKRVLCKTKFYSCVQAVIVAKYKEGKRSAISNKEFEHAVGKVMNNAKDGDGHRSARAKK